MARWCWMKNLICTPAGCEWFCKSCHSCQPMIRSGSECKRYGLRCARVALCRVPSRKSKVNAALSAMNGKSVRSNWNGFTWKVEALLLVENSRNDRLPGRQLRDLFGGAERSLGTKDHCSPRCHPI